MEAPPSTGCGSPPPGQKTDAAPSPIIADGSPDGSPSLDALAFDASLSFLDGMDDMSGTNASSLLDVAQDQDAAALLEEMLSLASDEQSVPSHESRTPSPPVELARRPQSRSTTSRARQKAEMEYLRQEVAALEAEVERLKQRSVSPGGEASGETAGGVWESIARRQLCEKQRAEVENVKLREQLEGQLRVAQSLEKLLRRRSLTDSDALFFEQKRPRGASGLDIDDAVKEIRQRINKQLDEVHSVIVQCGLASITTDMDEAGAVNDSENSICMEFLMVKEFPFEFERVADAVWTCVSADHIKLANGFYGASERSDWMCELRFSVKLSIRRSEATIHVRGIGARRMEAGQSMIVFESIGITEGQLFAGQSISIRERGYVLIEDVSSATSSPSTIVKVCVRMRPEVETGDAVSKAPQAGRFVDLVVGSYNQNTKTMLQLIENMLVLPADLGSVPPEA